MDARHHPQTSDSPRLILLADDELLVAEMTRTELVAVGFEVVGPASGVAMALDLARKHDPCAAVVDIRMQEAADGFECVRRLWDELRVPSVILSAFGGDDFSARAKSAGAFGYVMKPATGQALKAALAVAFARALDDTRHRDDARGGHDGPNGAH